MDQQDNAAPAVSIGPDDMRSVINAQQLFLNAQINRGMEGDPDQAAHSMRMADYTGVPAPLIDANYDQFIDSQKKQAAQQIVSANPDLQSYVMSHPLATTLSQDDWANLDKFTREARQPMGLGLTEPLDNAIMSTLEGAGQGALAGLQTGTETTDADVESMDLVKHPFSGLVNRALWAAADIATRGMGAVGGAISGGAGAAGEAIGGPRLGREFQGIAESEMNRGMAEAGLHVHAAEPVPKDPMPIAKPFLAAGEEPPTGLHPAIDEAKANVNAEYVQKLAEDLSNAASSETRARSPELFAKLTEQMYGDSSIGIHSDAVLALYGDKLPELDDGLLGWVPDLADQLMQARDIGGDINIPLKDWMAKVDPAVAKGLQDDLRVWPGGVTANEAKLLPPNPRGVVEDPLPLWRASMATEPLAGMGDRKLTLQAVKIEPGDQFHPEVHNFDMLDENGQPVGNMEIIPGPDKKTLYVNWIGGQAGMWANSFGPALIRDIKRQLREAYPDYQYLTGHRVSGAREGANNFGPMPVPKMRLDVEGAELGPKVRLDQDLPSDHDDVREILQGAYSGEGKRSAAPPGYSDVRGRGKVMSGDPNAPLPEWFDRVHQTLQDLGDKLGVKVDLYAGTAANKGYGGLASSAGHIILSDHLDERAALATGVHELGHQVEFQKFYQAPYELQQAIREAYRASSIDGKTVEQTRPITAQRYEPANRAGPASVDYHGNFSEWFAEQVSRWITTKDEPTSVVDKFFKGIADVWQKIYDAVKGHIGLSMPVDEFMRGLWRGEEDQPPHPITQAIEEQAQPNIEGMNNIQAAAVGLDVKSFAKLKAAIEERAKSDLAKAEARAVKEQTKRQSAEWKANRAEVAGKVAAEIKQRPDVAADLFLGSGELYGKKLQQRFTLAEDALTPEQKAALPEHYVSKNGLPPDAIAGYFGYSSGAEMIEGLAKLELAKQLPDGKRMRPNDFMRKLVQDETDRVMEQRYGKLSENIMSDAKDQALSDSSINVMHETLMAMAQKMGVTAFSKDVMMKAAKDIVASTSLGKVNSFRTMQEMGKHGRNAEAAMLAGKWGEAAVHLQKQTLTAMVGRELVDVEKEIGKFDKLANRWAKRDQPGVPSEYANWIHDVLKRSGKVVRRTPEDIARQIGGEADQSLDAFVKAKANEGSALDVWDQLYDPQWSKDYKALTVDEFRGVKASVESLIEAGKFEKQLLVNGVKIDLDAKAAELADSLKQFDWKNVEDQQAEHAVTRMPKGFMLGLTQIETLLGRFDQFDAFGKWTQTLFRDLKDGDNFADALRKDVSKRLIKADDGSDLTKGIKNTLFRAPEQYGGNLVQMTRASLRAVMLNWGNASNIKKLTKGWGVDEAAVKAFIDQNATKEDWDFAQKVWDIFDDLKEKSDTMYRSMGRMAPKSIEAQAIETPHGNYRGGYYPIMWHDTYARVPKLEGAGLLEPGYESLYPPAGYTQSRVNFFQPLSMDMDKLSIRLNQIIHDTAMRPSVTNFAKVLYHPDVRAAIETRAGLETFKVMENYIKTVANRANTGVDAWKDGGVLGRYFRENIQTALVGFNVLGTSVKHGFTALGLSMNEVGPKAFADAVRSLHTVNDSTGENNYQFAMRNSLELQRRDRNYAETLSGSVGELTGVRQQKIAGYEVSNATQKFMQYRQRLMELSSKPLAYADKLSSVPTWLAAYDKGIKEGLSYGDSVFSADRAVRRAHGSTAITSRPTLMNSWSPWITSFYTFFNDVFNRQMETVWRAGLAAKLAREGSYDAAMRHAKFAGAGVFAAAVYPAIVEAWSSPQESKPEDGWLKRSAKAMAYTESATMPVVRDMASFIMSNTSPDVGLWTTALKDLGQPLKDMFEQKQPLSPKHAEVLIKHAGALAGVLGAVPKSLVNPVAFGFGVGKGIEHPQGPWGWLVGARYGTLRGHSQTLSDYIEGRYDRRR